MIEQATYINNEGVEVQGWILLKNVQFKHVNFCANEINDECKDALSALLRRTNDDFGVTIAGNPISKPTVEALYKVATDTHASRVQADQIDQQIAIRRISY